MADNIQKQKEFLYFPISSLSELDAENVISKCEGCSDVIIALNLGIYDDETIAKMVSFVRELKNAGINVGVNIFADKKRFTTSDMSHFITFEAALKENGVQLSFDGGVKKNYTIKEVLIAQQKLNEFIASLKSQDLSPFEKYLVIYDFLTRKIYRENETNGANSRDIIALMNGDDIVCVGYAQLMEFICNAVGIKCMTQDCKIYDKNGNLTTKHQNNIVYIDDPKYKIKGFFYSDACWDHVEKGYEDKRTYSFCLIPLSDKNNMTRKIKINDDCMFFYPEPEHFFKLVDGEYYGWTFGKDINGEYSKILKQFDLEEKYNITGAMARDICSDIYRKKYALSMLREAFSQNNVPADVYRAKSNVPYGCSFEFLLAMCMCDSPNGGIIGDRIGELKKFYSSNKRLDISESSHSYTSDVYVEIAKMQADISYDNPEIQNPDRMLRWANVENKLTKAIMATSIFETMLDSKDELMPKPISAEAYRKALARAYRFEFNLSENVSDAMIQQLVDQAISCTCNVSNKAFTAKAKNCFKSELGKQMDS